MNDLISRQDDFEKQIHAMFDHIWDCEINHPVFQDTVGDLMAAVIQCHKRLSAAQPEPIKFHVNHVLTEEEIKSLMQKIADSSIMLMPSAEPEVTEEAVKEYCRKRGLTIITNDFFHELAAALPIIKSIKGV